MAGGLRRCWTSFAIGSTARPLRTVFFALLERSNILDYLRVDLPLRRSEEDRRRLVAVIRTVRDELAELFPASDFVLVLMPDTPNDPFTASLYAQAGLRVLDYRSLLDPDDPRMRVTATDPHPSALANQRIARQLVADLAAGPASE